MLYLLTALPSKLIIIAICGGLFALGGYSFLPARRFIMPFILAIMASVATNVWWEGLCVLPMIAMLCLGYGNFGSGNFARSVWLGLVALVAGVGLLLTGHLAIYFYGPYVIIAAVLAGIINNRLPQIVGDFIFGSWLATIVLIIH